MVHVGCVSGFFFFFKQKTAYDMRISDWSSDVCSSNLPALQCNFCPIKPRQHGRAHRRARVMTGATAKTTIKIGASHRERAAARLPLQPMFVSGGLHGHEAAAHHRMIGATELRAEKMISSGACGREPELRIAPGKHIDRKSTRLNSSH